MRAILPIYLFLLAATIGVELALGGIVAPVIFHPDALIGDGVLTRFQSGQLMTANFIIYGKILIAMCIVVLVYEMVNFNNNPAEPFNRRLSTLMLALIHLMLGLLFVLYFTDYIVTAQAGGAQNTQTAEFAKIHSASEWTAKIILIVQAIIFFMRFPKRKSDSINS